MNFVGAARDACSRQSFERSVLPDNDLTAAGFFNEANDRAGYFSKCHGLLPYHKLIEREPFHFGMRLREKIGYWREQAQWKSNRPSRFIGRLILEADSQKSKARPELCVGK